jgi:hypothetical protein
MAHLLSGGFDGPSYGDSRGRGKERQATLGGRFSEVLHDFLDPADAPVRAPLIKLCRVLGAPALPVIANAPPFQCAFQLAAGAADLAWCRGAIMQSSRVFSDGLITAPLAQRSAVAIRSSNDTR